jgi:diaminohydroxyphosphoribosylaminopyrimidine deaminase/5-amino-6-(5-phosphoribosylamino)uracil reductase
MVDREHRLLAVGAHRRIGFDHAEIDALKKIDSAKHAAQIAGGHIYVTLEPCAHQGRTPSCARTLAPLKPASVTYAVEDPFPLVAGKGAAILREAGVDARPLSDRTEIEDRDELIAQSEELAEVFLHVHRSQEPFVALKLASSLDGKMAFVSGESKWITGEKAREHVQLIRARYDAIAIGRNTFVADNPSLNVRHSAYPEFKNKVVVFDPDGQILTMLANSNLLRVRDPQSIFVIVREGVALTNPSGVRVISAPADEAGELNVTAALARLKTEGLTSIMVEGGAHTVGAFVREKKAQRLHLYLAPSLLGGKHGLAWSTHFGNDQMSGKIHLDRSHRELLGEDLYWTARLRYQGS